MRKTFVNQFVLILAFALAPLFVQAYDFKVDGIYYNITSTTDLTVEVTYKTIFTYSGSYSGDVTIPDTVTSDSITYAVTRIGGYAFRYSSRLTSITLPDAVTSIGVSAFCNCSSVTSISIPDAVMSIGSAAFYGCTGLTSITIPDAVTSIEHHTFYNCTGLTSITIPDAVTSIGTYAFYGCTSLASITLPDAVTSIGNYAFYGCTGFTSITIPDAVTSIGDYAFDSCSSLTDVYSLNTTPPTCTSSYCFSNYDATLHVPTDEVDTYASTSVWEDFATIVGDIDSAVESVSADVMEAQPTGYYSLSGQRLNAPSESGATIIRYSDGTAKKVFVK